MGKTKTARSPRSVKFINLPAQHKTLKAALLKKISQVIEHAHFILGPETQALEKEIAALCQAKHAVGLNSGTDALVLALRALNIGPGHEVIVPDFTFVATASAVQLVGAVPVLADIDPETFTLDPEEVKKRLTRRTRAIIPVHLYGQAADLGKLLPLARSHRLAVIEDAAQAVGAEWQGQPVGALGDMGCLSFFPTKNLGALGDAGLLLTNSQELAQRVLRLRNHGSEQKYQHIELGYNSRLDEIQAAALRVKLPYLQKWNARRRVIARAYGEAFRGLNLELPRTRAGNVHVFHQFAVRVKDRDALQKYLAERGVQTAVHYPLALHQQPLFRGLGSARFHFPHSEQAAREVLCLPIAPELTQQDVRQVVKAVKDWAAA